MAIRQLGREPVLADRNVVIFYNAGQRFFRALRDARGDHCYFVEMAPEAWAALTREEEGPELAFAYGPERSGRVPAPARRDRPSARAAV